MQALKKNQISEVVDIPKEKRLVGHKLVSTIKYKPDELLKNIRLDWWLKDISKPTRLITKRHLHPLQR